MRMRIVETAGGIVLPLGDKAVDEHAYNCKREAAPVWQSSKSMKCICRGCGYDQRNKEHREGLHSRGFFLYGPRQTLRSVYNHSRNVRVKLVFCGRGTLTCRTSIST